MAKKMKKENTSRESFLNSPATCQASSQDMTEQIRSKARELWEQQGRVDGRDLENWLEAERMVKAQRA